MTTWRTLLETLWALLPTLTVGAVLLGAGYSLRAWHQAKQPPGPWKVVVVPAEIYTVEYDAFSSGRAKVAKVEGEVAVRLVRARGMIPFATLRVDDDHYEERLDNLVAKAQARADTTNAHEQLLREP